MIQWLVCSADGCPNIEAERPPSFLSGHERQAYAQLAFAKRRREWLLGRWTAKHLLRLSEASHRRSPLHTIGVHNDPDGAPYLSVAGEGRLSASLSISHRDELALCAISLPGGAESVVATGADIERIEPRSLAFVRDFFTAQETEQVQLCPPALRDVLVAVIWSTKESALKVLRLGLRADTRQVEVGAASSIEAGRLKEREPCAWQPLPVGSRIPGGSDLVAWWRQHGDYVLTVAAAAPTCVAAASLEPLPARHTPDTSALSAGLRGTSDD